MRFVRFFRCVHPLTYVIGILVGITVGLSPSCDKLKSTATLGGKILVDCTKHETARVVDQLAPLAEKILVDAIDPDGKVDWQPVKDLAKGFTADVGGCVLSDVVARALKPSPPDPDAPQSSPLQVDRDALAAGFAELKADLFGGVTFKTASGEL